MAKWKKGDPRAKRGAVQIQQIGIDRATGKPKLFARWTTNGKRMSALLEATTRDAAKAELHERKKAALEGRPFREPPKTAEITVTQLAKECFGVDADFKTGHGGETRRPMRHRKEKWGEFKNHCKDIVGDKPASQLKRGDVKAMRDQLYAEELVVDGIPVLTADGLPVRKNSNRVVQRAVGVISIMYSWAMEEDRHNIEHNPAEKVKTTRSTASTSYYNDQEIDRLLAKSRDGFHPHLYAMIVMAINTGARRGEIGSLQWGDVDFESGKININRSWEYDARKSGAPVVVDIHPDLDAALKEIKPEIVAPNALVFEDPAGGMRDKFDDGLWGLAELIKVAKVRRFKRPWHAFRHTTGTNLANSGANLGAIRDVLGQSTVQMASHYTKISDELKKKAVHALPSYGAKIIALKNGPKPEPQGNHQETTDRTIATKKG